MGIIFNIILAPIRSLVAAKDDEWEARREAGEDNPLPKPSTLVLVGLVSAAVIVWILSS